jgi:hypothetical protein
MSEYHAIRDERAEAQASMSDTCERLRGRPINHAGPLMAANHVRHAHRERPAESRQFSYICAACGAAFRWLLNLTAEETIDFPPLALMFPATVRRIN